jgi:hypothetical protein
VFRVTTNQAGNFYHEGQQSDLAKPFRVEIDGPDADGSPRTWQMTTRPHYGGCARCHDPAVPAGPDPERTLNTPGNRIGQPFVGLQGRIDLRVELGFGGLDDVP